MILHEIISSLEELAPPLYQEAYDNARLICGNPEMKITRALCSLDCTEEVIGEAVANGCNLVIAHHPILFKGLLSLTGNNYVERTIIKAIKDDVAIYAIHTNLDNAWQGVNRKIAETLELKDIRVLAPKPGLLNKLFTYVPNKDAAMVRNALFEAGAGEISEYDRCSFNMEGTGTFRGSDISHPHVGKAGEEHHEQETKVEVIFPVHLKQKLLIALRESHPYEEVAYEIIRLENDHERLGSGMTGTLEKAMAEEEFMARLTALFQTPVIRHSRLLQRPVKKVALCGGAGSFLLPAAMRSGADVFITADFKYHEFFDAGDSLVIMDIGHFESERFTPELLRDFLVEKFPTFAVLLSGVKTNPVQYFIA